MHRFGGTREATFHYFGFWILRICMMCWQVFGFMVPAMCNRLEHGDGVGKGVSILWIRA